MTPEQYWSGFMSRKPPDWFTADKYWAAHGLTDAQVKRLCEHWRCPYASRPVDNWHSPDALGPTGL